VPERRTPRRRRYPPALHADWDRVASAAAERVVPLLLALLDVRSVVDVGCGTGAWLAAFRERGVADVLGIDGPDVPAELLRIPAGRLLRADLREPIALERTFDVALSLEVAEHLPPPAAEAFVASLARAAPVVVFSAAVPLQGGHGHGNEAWQGDWARRFAAHGLAPYDVLRARVWTDPQVAWWYAQNTLVYASPEAAARHPGLRDAVPVTDPGTLDLVHPASYLDLARRSVTPGAVARALAARLRGVLGRGR
jgi:SAM-dependent methyltransferase